MKRILIALLLTLSTVGLWAQSCKLELNGIKTEAFGKKVEYAVIQKLNGEQKDLIFHQTKESTTATIEIQGVLPNQIYMIGVNGMLSFFIPSDEGAVKADISGERFVFSGENAKINNLLMDLTHEAFYSYKTVALSSYLSKVMINRPIGFDITLLSDENYLNEIKGFRKRADDLLKKAKIKDSKLKNNIAGMINNIYVTTVNYSYMVLKNTSLTLPSSLLSEIDGYDFSSPSFAGSADCKMILNNYVRVQEDLGRVEFTLEDYIARKARCIENVDLRENYVFREIERLVKGKNLLFIHELIDSCDELVVKDRKKYLALKAEAKKLTDENTLDGEMAPNFTFENQNGEKVSLSDFVGKYVYIDVWATWCGPCKQEIPKLKLLEKEMENEKEMVFISLSVDKPRDKQKWQDFLKENNMHGITLITDNAFNVPFIQKYGINAIPRFMLIAPDGKMISNNCWRPSDRRLKVYLHSLLKPIKK